MGFRGNEAIDIDNLEALLVKLSNLIIQNPEIKGLDINPLFAYVYTAAIIDARIVLESQN